MPSPPSHTPDANTPPVRPGLALPSPAIHDSNSGTPASQLQPDTQRKHGKKRLNHRGGKKKKRARRPSFAVSTEDGSGILDSSDRQRGDSLNAARESFYRLHGGNASNTSLESEALLDHR